MIILSAMAMITVLRFMQMSKRHHPYDSQKRSQIRGRTSQAIQQSPPLPPSSASNHPATGLERTVRESFAEIVREKYPYFKPRTDFDIFALASGDYTGTPRGIYTWLDGELALYLALAGDMEAVMEETCRLLDKRGMITGVRKLLTFSICILGMT